MIQVLTQINQNIKANKKQLAVLIDPDNSTDHDVLAETIRIATEAHVDYFFIGGSLLVGTHFDECIKQIKATCNIPVIIFPGSPNQVSSHADAILFLSLISGRNPEALIGHHVIAAPSVKAAGLEVLPTGYMLIDSGRPTTASYMSNSSPIPHDKADIAACTALAGQYLGLQLIYLDGGSGAQRTVSKSMVSAVKQQVDIPIIVGGGIRTAEEATSLCDAGADIIVVGNAIEENPSLIYEISKSIHELSL